MHHSRLAGFIIDCQSRDLERAARFWSQALGYAHRPSADPDDADYVLLDTGPEAIHLEVQRVSHPSRIHLDIEADDLEAEVARLERLGARRVAQVKRWWVLEAPTGHRFCVVRPQRAGFAGAANPWP